MERKTGKSSFVVIVPDPSFFKKKGKKKALKLNEKVQFFV